MKYRKKPIVVEAFQLGVDSAPDCFKCWFKQRYSAIAEVTFSSKGDINIIIRTLEGDMHARKGDYIVQGVNGEIYPVKADIFEKTYERV